MFLILCYFIHFCSYFISATPKAHTNVQLTDRKSSMCQQTNVVSALFFKKKEKHLKKFKMICHSWTYFFFHLNGKRHGFILMLPWWLILHLFFKNVKFAFKLRMISFISFWWQIWKRSYYTEQSLLFFYNKI